MPNFLLDGALAWPIAALLSLPASLCLMPHDPHTQFLVAPPQPRMQVVVTFFVPFIISLISLSSDISWS